ncbi:MAG: hypothetical protein AAF800_03180 [Planctomycetota bacterium]
MNHRRPARRVRSVPWWIAGLAATLLLPATPAAAQVGSALVVVPWQPGRAVGATNFFLGQSTETDNAGEDLDLNRAVSFGRFRLDTDDPRAVSVGWLYDQLDLRTDDPALPERLVSTAVAGGMGLGEIIDGWDVGFSAGGGFAGDTPFTDEDAWFGLASVYATRRLDERRFLTLLLDYDGSRAFLPDWVLPGFQYTVVESPSLRYTVGLPFANVVYTPDDRWTIDVTYFIPLGGEAQVDYAIDDRWTAFGRYSSTQRGYHLDGDNENRRLFFRQDRLELGTRYAPADGWTWTFAGGWAFAQEFTRGFDTRDDDNVRDLDDAAFFRIGLNLSF